MSKQANTKVIGGFVVGAIALIIVGIMLFGSGKFLGKQKKFVLFFEDSVNGLSIGAPVDFRGVKVGKVTDIRIVLQREDLSLRIPVFVQIEEERISLAGSDRNIQALLAARGEKTLLDLLINQGMKAQLSIQSLVTGQLGIHLDFYPDKPVRLVGAAPDYVEIPTIQSSLSALSKTVENIPIAEIADKVLKTLDGIEKLVSSPDLQGTVVALHQTVNEARTVLQNLDGQLTTLATGADSTLEDAQKLLTNISRLARNLDSRIPQLATSLEAALKSTDKTMKQAGSAVDGIAGDNSPVRLELVKALKELASTARSFRILAQYLETHPEALIRGKGK